jgi:hypothetical protein
MDEGRKRVLAIVAGIIVARHLDIAVRRATGVVRAESSRVKRGREGWPRAQCSREGDSEN